jgi:hypothetical protein
MMGLVIKSKFKSIRSKMFANVSQTLLPIDGIATICYKLTRHVSAARLYVGLHTTHMKLGSRLKLIS